MNTDFKTNFLIGEENTVNITSTEKSRLTSGPFKLAQKVTHSLLTNIGDDIFDPDWGSNLLEVFRMPPSGDTAQTKTAFRLANMSVKKTQVDVLNQQSKMRITDENISSMLKKLTLKSVTPDLNNNTWEIDIDIETLNGDTLNISFP